MKLSDYVASFLKKEGIKHVFAISGGASVHLIHSIADTPGIDYICPQHEQAGSMSAEGYSRATGNLGAAIGTSGPGATNMLTGVCCAYYDSIPVIYISGQVSRFRLKKDLRVRQIGFQETDIVDIFKPVTKYAVLIEDPKKIKYELEKACHLARTDRPGPVLIDIPDDVQREDIFPENLESFFPEPLQELENNFNNLHYQVNQCLSLIENSKRPVIIAGWGIRLSKAEKEALEFFEKLGFPVVPTWGMMDFLPSVHPLFVGGFGTHGTRHGNFAIQNSDLIISVGARLDTHETGSPLSTFAREAKKIVVDIDAPELAKFEKFEMKIEVPIHSDAKKFFQDINPKINLIRKNNINGWIEKISNWKQKYPSCSPEYYQEEGLNPYVFVKTLSQELLEGDIIFSDTGCSLAWMMQAFEFKKNQRFFHDFNNTAMGYALPASIGACFALDRKPIICVVGDGSLRMSMQELATVIKHNLPLKIFVINNQGYSMICQTQDQWLDSNYEASSVEGGLPDLNYLKIAEAYGFKTVNLTFNNEVNEKIKEVLHYPGPMFCNVNISRHHRVIPQVKFGRPIEDSEPLLNRKEFLENMIVKVLDASLKP